MAAIALYREESIPIDLAASPRAARHRALPYGLARRPSGSVFPLRPAGHLLQLVSQPHCGKCQTNARDQWLRDREKELLNVPYVHVVFTLPNQLSPLTLANKRVLYDLLLRASAATLLEIAADPKHLGAEIGFMSVLHTWGQNVLHHPHAHCVLPAGGLSLDHQHWVHPR